MVTGGELIFFLGAHILPSTAIDRTPGDNMLSLAFRQLILAALLCTNAGIAGAAPSGSAELLITSLYMDFGCPGPSIAAPDCDSVQAMERKGITEQPSAVLRRYFDAPLTALLVKDRECVLRLQEICNLDFDLLYASQDPDAADLSIKASADDHVTVSFRCPSNGKRIAIEYRLVPTQDGPRIADVIYPDKVSLKKLLMQK